jgi:aldose 1-epimerase
MKPLLAAAAAAALALTILSACAQTDASSSADSSADAPAGLDRVERSVFGQLPGGRTVHAYRVTNDDGMTMRVITYGGIITSLTAPDAEGDFEDVVLGFDTLSKYRSDAYRSANPYFGALIGRYGNRIAGAQFSLDGQTYKLAANDGANHLHGGNKGFNRVLWDAEPFQDEDGAGLTLSYTSPGGEEGYPGTLQTRITYTLTDAGELAIDYRATTTEATPVNLTQHSYFNLAGEGSASILDHRLMINAERFTPVNESLIPTGERATVEGTPFDFTEFTPIGARIAQGTPQLEYAGGYDHNFVLNREGVGRGELAVAARVWEPESGRLMTVRTTEPGLQFYSGNFLQGTLTGKSGQPYERRSGFALETQHFPNSPNEPSFPSTILRPGETYTSRTVYEFDARDTL